jgi:hypothetical protein
MRRQRPCFLLSAVFIVGLVGCGEDEEGTSSHQETYSISGTVTRSIDLDPNLWICKYAPLFSGFGPEKCDAKGDIYLHLMHTCPSLSGCLPEIIAETIIPDADLSGDGASIPFEMKNLPNGTYYLSGLMDDAPNIFNPPDISETGDLVMFGETAPKCVEVIVDDGDVSGISADFGDVMPFALPMDSKQCDEREEADPVPVDDGNTYTVTATVIRDVAISLLHRMFWGTDGIGPLRIALLDECFSSEGNAGQVRSERAFDEVDLSVGGSEFTFDFDAVPNGIYYINGFIDDVTNATEERPLPGIGDLVSFHDLGPGCTKVVVNGADVVADPYPLNMIMVFDLNAM